MQPKNPRKTRVLTPTQGIVAVAAAALSGALLGDCSGKIGERARIERQVECAQMYNAQIGEQVGPSDIHVIVNGERDYCSQIAPTLYQPDLAQR